MALLRMTLSVCEYEKKKKDTTTTITTAASTTKAAATTTTTTITAAATKRFVFNKVWLWTTLMLSWSFFVQNGIHYYGPRVFGHQYTWGLKDGISGPALLVVCGFGGFVGLAGIAPHVDRMGGYKPVNA